MRRGLLLAYKLRTQHIIATVVFQGWPQTQLDLSLCLAWFDLQVFWRLNASVVSLPDRPYFYFSFCLHPIRFRENRKLVYWQGNTDHSHWWYKSCWLSLWIKCLIKSCYCGRHHADFRFLYTATKSLCLGRFPSVIRQNPLWHADWRGLS